MPAPDAHPPVPGPIVTPNFLAIMEAVGNVTFPISKRELVDQVDGGTVLFRGRNVDLHELLKDIHDDFFDSEAELLAALERQYGAVDDVDGGVVPTGPQESWQTRTGPGSLASSGHHMEPSE